MQQAACQTPGCINIVAKAAYTSSLRPHTLLAQGNIYEYLKGRIHKYLKAS
jgi:hypothetical protein